MFVNGMFEIGDKVKTDYYVKDRHLVRTVTRVERVVPSQTGVFVTTRDEMGRELSCDSAWYHKV